MSQSGFWAKALPEEFANEGNIIAFWVDKKGRVFYRINDSAAMLFFNGVRTADPLWALVDVYGLTRGVHLLGECLLPPAPQTQGTPAGAVVRLVPSGMGPPPTLAAVLGPSGSLGTAEHPCLLACGCGRWSLVRSLLSVAPQVVPLSFIIIYGCLEDTPRPDPGCN